MFSSSSSSSASASASASAASVSSAGGSSSSLSSSSPIAGAGAGAGVLFTRPQEIKVNVKSSYLDIKREMEEKLSRLSPSAEVIINFHQSTVGGLGDDTPEKIKLAIAQYPSVVGVKISGQGFSYNSKGFEQLRGILSGIPDRAAKYLILNMDTSHFRGSFVSEMKAVSESINRNTEHLEFINVFSHSFDQYTDVPLLLDVFKAPPPSLLSLRICGSVIMEVLEKSDRESKSDGNNASRFLDGFFRNLSEKFKKLQKLDLGNNKLDFKDSVKRNRFQRCLEYLATSQLKELYIARNSISNFSLENEIQCIIYMLRPVWGSLILLDISDVVLDLPQPNNAWISPVLRKWTREPYEKIPSYEEIVHTAYVMPNLESFWVHKEIDEEHLEDLTVRRDLCDDLKSARREIPQRAKAFLLGFFTLDKSIEATVPSIEAKIPCMPAELVEIIADYSKVPPRTRAFLFGFFTSAGSNIPCMPEKVVTMITDYSAEQKQVTADKKRKEPGSETSAEAHAKVETSKKRRL